MAALGIGLAGYGRFGRLHARVIADLPGARVAAVCDASEPARERARRELPDASVHASFDDMLAAGVDAVDVVTDEAEHGAQTLAALDRGLPVLVEKPLATAVEQAVAIAKAARQRGAPVLAGHVSRFDHRYAALREAIASGLLGRVVSVTARRGFSRAWFEGFGSRVHPVFESMVHDIDLAIWYLDAPATVVYARAHASTGTAVPDVLSAIVTSADGRMISLQSNWLVPRGAVANLPGPELDPLDLHGTIEAIVEVSGTRGSGRVTLDRTGLELLTDAPGESSSGLWPIVHGRARGALAAELAHFRDLVRDQRPSEIVPLEGAVATVAIADAIVRSAAAGEPVAVRC